MTMIIITKLVGMMLPVIRLMTLSHPIVRNSIRDAFR
uniref:Uncharacterized protein n=1 Tax=Picea sitchensis TaxID=3332 RepID=A0A6B9XVN6_PICSI|nr:hypothetical protein Q903MT_gene4059 [Picea sitchensis]